MIICIPVLLDTILGSLLLVPCTIQSCSVTVACISLSDPENGNVTCPSNTSIFRDTCTYYCNCGYQLEGNRQTRCDVDGTWSSEPVTCTILTCNDPKMEIPNSQSVSDCSNGLTYGSSCSLDCSSGYSISGNGKLVCDVNDDGVMEWRSTTDSFSCINSKCSFVEHLLKTML